MADRAVCGPRALLVSPADFLVLAQQALARRDRTGAELAVVAVGIEEADSPGSVTDRPGGHALLGAVAELILSGLVVADAAAVTGSGELVILCGRLGSSGEADPIVRRAQDMAGLPMQADKVPVRVLSASGVAMASAPQDTAEQLVATAVGAMRAQRTLQPDGLGAHAPLIAAGATGW